MIKSKKKIITKNEFDREELNRYYSFTYSCAWCKKQHANCFHHIMGRTGEHHNSILNAAFLNNEECHLPLHGKISKIESAVILLERTLTLLLQQGYSFTENDIAFIEKHKDLYEQIIASHKKVVNT